MRCLLSEISLQQFTRSFCCEKLIQDSRGKVRLVKTYMFLPSLTIGHGLERHNTQDSERELR